VDECLFEVSDRYYASVKKSILDYVLADPREQRRLGLVFIKGPVTHWGTGAYEGVSALPEERAFNAHSRDMLEMNLVCCSPATGQILREWEEGFTKTIDILALPEPNAPRLTVSDFCKAQNEHLNRVKARFLEFLVSVNEIYEQCLPTLDDN
jgi:hypothetical protein